MGIKQYEGTSFVLQVNNGAVWRIRGAATWKHNQLAKYVVAWVYFTVACVDIPLPSLN